MIIIQTKLSKQQKAILRYLEVKRAKRKYQNKKYEKGKTIIYYPEVDFVSTKELSWFIAKQFNTEVFNRKSHYGVSNDGSKWREFQSPGYYRKQLTNKHKASFSRSLKRLANRGLITFKWTFGKYNKYVKLNKS